MHQGFTFIQKKSRSKKFVQRLLKTYGENEHTIERFYLYQTLIKQKNNNYMNEDALKYYSMFHEPKCEIFDQREQEVYLKISRLLIKYFF